MVILHGADPFSPALPLMSKRTPGTAAAWEGQSHRSLMAPRAHRPHDFPVSLVMFWGCKEGLGTRCSMEILRLGRYRHLEK